MTREELLKIAKPILFNTEMVQAILEGRKTVTRRVIKPQPTYSPRDGFTYRGGAYGIGMPPEIESAAYNLRCAAPYKVNDVLWVRETWGEDKHNFLYRADFSENDLEKVGHLLRWRPSIHMPKAAARIFLRVTNVRVERVQDITEEQAKAEGSNVGISWTEKLEHSSIERFEKIWNSTIKKADLDKYGWEANPWVWVVEFERVEV